MKKHPPDHWQNKSRWPWTRQDINLRLPPRHRKVHSGFLFRIPLKPDDPGARKHVPKGGNFCCFRLQFWSTAIQPVFKMMDVGFCGVSMPMIMNIGLFWSNGNPTCSSGSSPKTASASRSAESFSQCLIDPDSSQNEQDRLECIGKDSPFTYLTFDQQNCPRSAGTYEEDETIPNRRLINKSRWAVKHIWYRFCFLLFWQITVLHYIDNWFIHLLCILIYCRFHHNADQPQEAFLNASYLTFSYSAGKFFQAYQNGFYRCFDRILIGFIFNELSFVCHTDILEGKPADLINLHFRRSFPSVWNAWLPKPTDFPSNIKKSVKSLHYWLACLWK